jgi:hypothetical protein
MADELETHVAATYTKDGIVQAKTFDSTTTVFGSHPIANVASIGVVDETLALGDVGSTPGMLVARNRELLAFLGNVGSGLTPSTPTVTPNGTTGAATWSYKIVAKDVNGLHSAASSAGTTTSGNANLTGGNFNRITWPDVTGATEYDVYRTAHGTTPATNGLIASGVTSPLDDTGLAGDGSTAPTTGQDNVVSLGADGSSYPIMLKGDEFFMVRWNGSAIHAIASTVPVNLEYLLLPD